MNAQHNNIVGTIVCILIDFRVINFISTFCAWGIHSAHTMALALNTSYEATIFLLFR